MLFPGGKPKEVERDIRGRGGGGGYVQIDRFKPSKGSVKLDSISKKM